MSGYLWAQSISKEELQRRIAEKEAARYMPGTAAIAKTAITGPEQDCPNAIPVCTNTYHQPNSYTGIGTQQEVPTTSCLGVRERNSVWYILSVQSSGNLAFNITPVNMSEDYDFAVYNLTGKTCADIVTGAAPEVRCNFSADPGVTGLSSAGTNPSEPASGPKFSSLLPVTAGQTYVLVIDNYSQSQNGYTLDFSPSTATIFDNVAPMPVSTITPCGVGTLTLQMSEAILCTSIASNGSDFLISGPGGPFTVTSASGVLCGTQTSQITINFTPALIMGSTYTLTIKTGTDGNTLQDLCGNFTPVNTTFNFTATPPPASIAGPNFACKNAPFTLTAYPSGATSYSWTKNPSPVVIGTGQTLTQTLSTTGSHTYNVTVTNGTCTQTASITITVRDAPTANFTYTPMSPVTCGTPINFNSTSTLLTSCNGLGIVPCGFSCTLLGGSCQPNSLTSYLWSWGDMTLPNYGIGATNSQTHTYSSAGTYTVTLTVTDPVTSCSNSISQTITVVCALPIEQLNFNALADKSNAVLYWKTKNLPQVTHFVIEKSLDKGHSFEAIAEIPTHPAEYYQFIDKTPNLYDSPILYRLKVYNRDGSFVFSDAKEVIVSGVQNQVWVYPNPVTHYDTWNMHIFSTQEQNAEIQIYSTVGQLIYQQNVSLNRGNQTIHIPTIQERGTYFAKIRIGGDIKTIPILVQ
ncbi:MAG: PKD domain-containing protein [Bacteroidia bacterium]|nr:PKD domain-containing protein [Bacteroidia bacterium]MDW8348253.1 PKD domain-containing protein [Bacteroidia bacterium]